MVTFAAEAQVNAVVAHAFAMQAFAGADLRHQVRCELFEHSGPHAAHDVV